MEEDRLTQTLRAIQGRHIVGPKPEAIRLRLSLPGGTSDVEAPGPEAMVGAHQNADIVLPSRSVSALHCKLAVCPDGSVLLSDLGSKNGTWIGEVGVGQVRLRPGAKFQVGDVPVELLPIGTVDVSISVNDRFGEFFGVGGRMGTLIAKLELLAPTEMSVLIIGEPGTGKELIARGLHDQSGRRGPFVVLDCAGLNAGTASSEIFGHAKGAFTGAIEAKAGKFEAANGGTIFIDEIGDLPLELQPLLLRALESKTTCRVGENEYRAFDARVVAATNRDLWRDVNEGRFREDLYFRIAQDVIEVPPLRSRGGGNILLLAELFLDRFSESKGVEMFFSQDAKAEMEGHRWRGNVRELLNVVSRAAQLTKGATIGVDDLALSGAGSFSKESSAPLAWAIGPWDQAKAEFLRRYVALILSVAGTRDAANVLMAVSPSTFHSMLKKAGFR